MKKALLTGSTGFLGRHVKRYIEEFTNWDLICYEGDLTHRVECERVDYVINLASLSSVEASVDMPKSFIMDNVKMTLNLLDWARRFPPQVFLHFSSVEVYNITNPYAASKAAQEEIATAYWKTFDVPVIIARSTNIVGEGQTGDKFIPTIIRAIEQGEPVTVYKGGKRTYNTVRNVADAIVYMLRNYPLGQDPDKQNEELPIHYDIPGGESLTNLAMAKLVAQKLGKELDYEEIEPKAARPTYAQQLVARGVSLATEPWAPPETLREGLSWIKSE